MSLHSERLKRLKPSWWGGNMLVSSESEDSSGLPGCKSVPVIRNQAGIRARLLRLRIYSESTSHHLKVRLPGHVLDGRDSLRGVCVCRQIRTLMTLSRLL